MPNANSRLQPCDWNVNEANVVHLILTPSGIKAEYERQRLERKSRTCGGRVGVMICWTRAAVRSHLLSRLVTITCAHGASVSEVSMVIVLCVCISITGGADGGTLRRICLVVPVLGCDDGSVCGEAVWGQPLLSVRTDRQAAPFGCSHGGWLGIM